MRRKWKKKKKLFTYYKLSLYLKKPESWKMSKRNKNKNKKHSLSSIFIHLTKFLFSRMRGQEKLCLEGYFRDSTWNRRWNSRWNYLMLFTFHLNLHKCGLLWLKMQIKIKIQMQERRGAESLMREVKKNNIKEKIKEKKNDNHFFFPWFFDFFARIP